MRLYPAILGCLLLAGRLFAQQAAPIGTDRFSGLDDTDAPNTINNDESQNVLNVEANVLGTAIMKRRGFSQIAALTVATSAVTGAYSFIDKNGNQQVIVCQDANCAHSVNAGAFAVIYSTATSGVARWGFADYNGIVYAVDDKNDQPWSYDGTTFTQPVSSNSFPSGSLIEQSKDRLIISGVTTAPSSVYYSQSGTFTNFVTNGNSPDPWVDPIGTAGDKVTALKYDSGNLYIFKRTSITLCILADQFSTVCYPIANTIGTNSPASIVSAPDGIYFQSQTGAYWKIPTYGLYGLELVSKKITNFVKSQPSQFGSTGNNLQGTQSDWNAGTQTPAGSYNTSVSPGSIFNSSTSFSDLNYSTFTFSANVSTNDPSAIGSAVLLRSTWSITNGSFSQGNITNWSSSPVGAWTYDSGTFTGSGCALLEGSPTNSAKVASSKSNLTVTLTATNANGNTIKSCTLLAACLTPTICTYTSDTCDVSQSSGTITGSGTTFTRLIGLTIAGANTYNGMELVLSVNGSSITSTNSAPANQMFALVGFVPGAPNSNVYFKSCGTPNYMASGTLTSGNNYDTTYSTPTWGPFNVNLSSSSDRTATFQTKVSADNITFDGGVTVANGAKITSAQKRYIEWTSSLAQTLALSTGTPQINSDFFVAAETGTFVTQCIQPGPNITSWGTLNCDTANNSGSGSEVFYAASAATCAALPTTPPINAAGSLNAGWSTQSNNAVIGVATNAALEIGWRDLLGSATDQAQINDCATNWFDTTQPQPVFGTYDPIKNALYWSTANNSMGTNNRILKYDLNIAGNSYYMGSSGHSSPWFPWSISATALRMINGYLYFGSSTGGTWNEQGTVSNDNGSSVNGIWQSKDFSCNAPFVDSLWNRAYTVARNQQAGSITTKITNSLGTTDNYSISQSTSAAQNYVRSTHSIQNFSSAPFVNIQYSNNSLSNQFEIDGFKLDCVPQEPMDENP